VSLHPARGDIWLFDFGVPVGHEAGYRRPALDISSNRLNRVQRLEEHLGEIDAIALSRVEEALRLILEI